VLTPVLQGVELAQHRPCIVQQVKTIANELEHDGLTDLSRERMEFAGQHLRISSSRQLRVMLASGEASGVMLSTAEKQAVGEGMEKPLPVGPVSPCLLNLIITAFVHRTIHNGKGQLFRLSAASYL
jgi:hypothetical protein